MSSPDHAIPNKKLTPLKFGAQPEKFDSIHDSAPALVEQPQYTCVSVDSTEGHSVPFLSMINKVDGNKDLGHITSSTKVWKQKSKPRRHNQPNLYNSTYYNIQR